MGKDKLMMIENSSQWIAYCHINVRINQEFHALCLFD